ncbi:MAG: hypothetical protein AAF916_03045 [Planctomycetota bacterium]
MASKERTNDLLVLKPERDGSLVTPVLGLVMLGKAQPNAATDVEADLTQATKFARASPQSTFGF